MGMFNRSKLDTSAYFGALTHGTYEEFLAIHEPAHANATYSSGTPLTLALSNGDPEARVAIATRLLDDGADAGTAHPLHVLLGQNTHDFPLEAPLLQRLLDDGADVNERTEDGMTPLEQAASKFKFSDASLQPFYDVLLARPDLDLVGPGLDGRPVLVNLRKWYAKRAALVERAEALLTERGVPLPEPQA